MLDANASLNLDNQGLFESLKSERRRFKAEIHRLNALLESKEERLKMAHDLYKKSQIREKELLALDITPEFKETQKAISSGYPFILITGGAGTGKSEFIKTFLKPDYHCPVVAPTGVAALNVGGKTIHSLFHFKVVKKCSSPACVKLDKNNVNRFKEIKRLVIDEISMVRSDLMDLIDYTLRESHESEKPFGGVQIVAIGDLYQLPPVVDENVEQFFDPRETAPALWERWPGSYFFNAICMRNIKIKHIEFTKIFRQGEDEKEYIACLNNVRLAKQNEESVNFLNQRVRNCTDNSAAHLFPHNRDVDKKNQEAIEKLPGDPIFFKSKKSGSYAKVNEKELPAPSLLQLKIGAKVMFVNNNYDENGNSIWVNGTMGKVTDIISRETDKEVIEVEILDTAEKHLVQYATWEDNDYDKNKKIITVGTFKQLPIMLAWAFTVHKIQGKTCTQIIYSPAKTFGPGGMAYVALSRTKKMSDLYLTSPLSPSHITSNKEIQSFLKCNR
ncbi:MAG: DEAD/DEAH box helicase [Victivallaceae bacterium]